MILIKAQRGFPPLWGVLAIFLACKLNSGMASSVFCGQLCSKLLLSVKGNSAKGFARTCRELCGESMTSPMVGFKGPYFGGGGGSYRPPKPEKGGGLSGRWARPFEAEGQMYPQYHKVKTENSQGFGGGWDPIIRYQEEQAFKQAGNMKDCTRRYGRNQCVPRDPNWRPNPGISIWKADEGPYMPPTPKPTYNPLASYGGGYPAQDWGQGGKAPLYNQNYGVYNQRNLFG